MKDEPILVAIQCMVYNHEPYLRDCFEGFVMQKTNFRFVAIVHDDCSTDGSANIIREYTEKYPDIFRPIYETENQFSKHDGSLARIMNNAISETGAKYIAFCEGDDYWTDSMKLQRQVDFLESHSDYTAIAENGLVHDSIKGQEYPISNQKSHDVSLEDALTSSRIQTVAVLCRKDATNGFFQTCKFHHDIVLWCWLISKGKFRFSDIISTVYRKGRQGITVYTPIYTFTHEMEERRLDILRVFHLSKRFMYKIITRMYIGSCVGALKRRNIADCVYCGVRSCYYLTKWFLCTLKLC